MANPERSARRSASTSANSLLEGLNRPFDAGHIRFAAGPRISDGAAHPIAFLEAERLHQRFDKVLGQAGWQHRFNPAGDVCTIAVLLNGAWLEKAGYPAPGKCASGPAPELAFRAAAAAWGVGRHVEWARMPAQPVNEHGEFLTQPVWPAPSAAPATRPVAVPSPAPTSALSRAVGDSLSALESDASERLPRRQALSLVDTSADAGNPAAIGASSYQEPSAAEIDLLLSQYPEPPHISVSHAAEAATAHSAPAENEPHPAEADPKVLGTPEQWASLGDGLQVEAQVLLERVESSRGLHSVREYLTTGGGSGHPQWLRDLLLAKIRVQLASSPF